MSTQVEGFARVPPRWHSLKTLGEMRLLQLSYAALFLIPLWGQAVAAWNETVVTPSNEVLCRSHEAAIAALDEAGASSNAISTNGRASNWRRYCSTLSYEPSNGRASSILDDGELDALDRWIEDSRAESWRLNLAALRFAAMGGVRIDDRLTRPIEFSQRMKWLLVAMTAIAAANLLYGIGCPSELRIVHRPHRQGPATGTGDRMDWCVNLLRQLSIGDPERSRYHRELTATLQRSLPADRERLSSSSVPEFVLAEWNRFQTSRPLARVTCFLLYSFAGISLAAIAVTKVIQVLRIP